MIVVNPFKNITMIFFQYVKIVRTTDHIKKTIA